MIDEPITLLSSTSELLRKYHQRRKNGMQVSELGQRQIDEYVIDNAEYYKLDDFEYTVQPVIMTGREYGELLADW